MATRASTSVATNNSRSTIIVWSGLLQGDDGQPMPFSAYTDKSVQVTGTVGGASLAFEGSNDGVNYHTLTDPQGNALLFTAVGLSRPWRPRPSSAHAWSAAAAPPTWPCTCSARSDHGLHQAPVRQRRGAPAPPAPVHLTPAPVRVECTATFLDGATRYEAGETRVVPAERASYFIAQGWAKVPGDADATQLTVDPVTLGVNSSKMGTTAAGVG